MLTRLAKFTEYVRWSHIVRLPAREPLKGVWYGRKILKTCVCARGICASLSWER